jgi:hypothetical protein
MPAALTKAQACRAMTPAVLGATGRRRPELRAIFAATVCPGGGLYELLAPIVNYLACNRKTRAASSR